MTFRSFDDLERAIFDAPELEGSDFSTQGPQAADPRALVKWHSTKTMDVFAAWLKKHRVSFHVSGGEFVFPQFEDRSIRDQFLRNKKRAMNLRSATIRLAHEKPELRAHLLPLLKEATPAIHVLDEKGRSYVGDNVSNFSMALLMTGMSKPARDDLMDRLVGSQKGKVVVPTLPGKILKELLKRKVIVPGPKGPPVPRVLRPLKAIEKLEKEIDRWVRGARSDFSSSDFEEGIESAAFDLARSFLYEEGISELVEQSRLRPSVVVEMVANRLV